MALAGAAAILGGCTTVGPDFERPHVPWLSGWTGGSLETLAADPRRPRNGSMQQWWQNFNDPVLDKLVAEAQRVNPSVRTAGMRIMEARAQLGIADSTRYPQLQQANGELLGVGEQRENGRDNKAWTASVGFSLGWEIDFWGKFRRSIESADAAYFASIAQYDDIQVLMAAQVAGLYTSIRTVELRCGSLARTRSCKSAACRSRSCISGAATSLSWTSSRPRPSTWAPSRQSPSWRSSCASRKTP